MADYIIQMTPDELRDGASYLENRKSEIMDLLSDMKSKVDAVCNNWQGAAEESFFESFNSLYDQIAQALPETVEGIETMLTGSADTLEEADEQIGSSLKI